MSRTSMWPVAGALALALASSLAVAEPPHHGGPPPHFAARPGFRHDIHYGHNQFYPMRGYAVRALPPGAFAVNRFHDHFFFAGGVWYAPRGPGFVVVRPPAGVFLPVLPPYYTTVWLGGLPYYYANDTYYEYDEAQHGYEVVDPPAGSEEEAAAAADGDPGAPPPEGGDYNAPPPPAGGYAPPPAAPGAGAGGIGGGLFVYPVNGQSDQQQSQDKWECHKWAVGQSGFDPTSQGGDPGRSVGYRRAMQACLQGRGYSVK